MYIEETDTQAPWNQEDRNYAEIEHVETDRSSIHITATGPSGHKTVTVEQDDLPFCSELDRDYGVQWFISSAELDGETILLKIYGRADRLNKRLEYDFWSRLFGVC